MIHMFFLSENTLMIANQTRFFRGQLVRHQRYGYRGVIVEYDLACRAPDTWYLKNLTQPLRQQPWYHVLVHESSTATYAAEISLYDDDDPQPIVHPLISVLFDDFDGKRYIRNDHRWPGWETE